MERGDSEANWSTRPDPMKHFCYEEAINYIPISDSTQSKVFLALFDKRTEYLDDISDVEKFEVVRTPFNYSDTEKQILSRPDLKMIDFVIQWCCEFCEIDENSPDLFTMNGVSSNLALREITKCRYHILYLIKYFGECSFDEIKKRIPDIKKSYFYHVTRNVKSRISIKYQYSLDIVDIVKKKIKVFMKLRPVIMTNIILKTEKELEHEAKVGIILKVVCDEYAITLDKLKERGRETEYVVPRMIAAFLIRWTTGYPLIKIGDILSTYKMDHSSVIHYCKCMVDIIETKMKFVDNIRNIFNTLGDYGIVIDTNNTPQWYKNILAKSLE